MNKYLIQILMLLMLIVAMESTSMAEVLNQQRIKFPRGETSTVIENGVPRGYSDEYLLGASTDQEMIVHITSIENNAVFQLYTPYGQTLDNAGEGEDATYWHGILPVSGDYKIVVGATRGGTEYTLKITIQNVPYHTVIKGETLYRISKQYGYKVSELAEWNNLSSYSLQVGQLLRLSASPTKSVETERPVSEEIDSEAGIEISDEPDETDIVVEFPDEADEANLIEETETVEIPNEPKELVVEIPDKSEETKTVEIPEDSEELVVEIPDESEETKTVEIPEDSEELVVEIPNDSEETKTVEIPEDSEELIVEIPNESEETETVEIPDDSEQLVVEIPDDSEGNIADKPEASTQVPVSTKIKNLWKNLDSILAVDLDCQALSSTWLSDLGLRGFYCHILEELNYEQLQTLVKRPIFVQGPHDHALNLNADYEFGYYNKDFVKWLRENAIPATKDPAFRNLTQPLYDKHVKSLAKTFYTVHQLLFEDLEYLNAEKEAYLKLVTTQQLPKFYSDRYWDFKGLNEQGFNNYEVNTAVLFWIRRVIDGTEGEFFAGLTSLIKTYEPQFTVNKIREPSTWTHHAPMRVTSPQFIFKLISKPAEELSDQAHEIERIEVYWDFAPEKPFQILKAPGMYLQSLKRGFEITDMNFDNYRDIRILGQKSSAFYWLFEPQQQQFVRSQTLEKLDKSGTLHFDAEQQHLQVTWQQASKEEGRSGIYGNTVYQFVDGQPVLFQQELYQVFSQVSEQAFTIVTILETGEHGMTVVEQNLVQGNLVKEKFGAVE